MSDPAMLEPANPRLNVRGSLPPGAEKFPPSDGISVEATRQIAERFSAWLDRVGYESFDPYDLWGTRYGLWSRSVYYRKGSLGLPFIAPILLAELIWPSVRRFFVRKERFATADGQLILAFLNLHKVTGQSVWLEKAVSLAEEVIGYSVPGYRGLCWGYPFDWQNSSGLWRKNTPYITSTPYCFEAFVELHAATGDPKFLERAASAAEFVHLDLTDKEMGPGATAASYSPHDQSDVINASAYRAWVLVEAATKLGRPELLVKAQQNIRFILQSQSEDGAWWYSVTNKSEAFIDHFHTCFVLKNLFKLNRHLGNEEVRVAIQKGYSYYREHLFNANDDPKSFAVEPRRQIVSLEMYNYAEAITLGALLADEVPGALALAKKLARRLGENYQLPDGHFVTRVFRGGRRHKFPFLRWPQAQLFYAITNLLLKPEGGPKPS